ncbi:WD40 repeat-like protein [Acephala macrosclerotiorum]|nr:WD40 repeat-like protein [Acephala macrosclerotiorum]
MADPPLPRIKVTDAQFQEGSATGTSGVDSPSTTTDGGQSARPRSATSSEGNPQSNGKKSPIKLIRNNTASKDVTVNGAKPSSPPAARPTSTAIDPLSHHILKRTNTENTIPQKLRTSELRTSTGPDSPVTELGSPISPDIAPPGRQLTPEVARSESFPAKEKKKGVSFLSRFSIIGGKKKDQPGDVDDDESELGDHRTEGMNAHVFSSSIGANGYIPQHKEPPRYIKVRAHNKKTREFNRMFLAQELSGTKHAWSDEKVPGLTTSEVGTDSHKLSKSPKTNGAVWATEFSKDGKYLAAAGRDQVVRVWAVISNPDERAAHEHEEDSNTWGGERLSAPVFRSKPIREFEGHTGDILDLSWSKNNFLLSSSMDKTVRLWHISRQECLCTFKHKDFVTSIAFHPRDDRFFLAGSLDSILRLWSIPDKSVAFWNQLPDLITAVAFSPDGKTAMAGVLSGLCLFYETEGLKYHTQIHVRSSRGKNAKGSKITGIRTTTFPPDDPEGEVKVLITSNDSRVRLYNLRDKSLEMKFRGHENTCSQIKASFSDDARYVICGSEDRKAYIWTTGPTESDNKDKRPMELFEAHSDMVTAAVIAPTKTRQLLSDSGDPIYDLCNPPPVTLLSREESRGESNASSVVKGDSDKRHSDPVSATVKTPAYLARSEHNDGLILVTADYLGVIKVYRCDCAYKRRIDLWESSSFSKKKILARSGSIMTRNSGGSHSRRGSLSQASQASFSGPQMQSDHILSWRNAITDDGGQRRASDRSVSPGKFHRNSQSTTNSQNNLASQQRQQQYASTTTTQQTPSVSTTSPPPSIHKTTARNNAPSQPPTPGFTYSSADDNNSLKLDAVGKSNQFWNLSSWKQLGAVRDPSKLDSGSLMPPLERGTSVISKLSSEEGDSPVDEDESESEALTCRKCGGKDFRARKPPGRGLVMVCTRCGSTVE